MNSIKVSNLRNSLNHINIKIVFLCLLIALLFLFFTKGSFGKLGFKKYSELNQIQGKNLSFSELSKFFKELAIKKGAEHAFGVLNVAQLPPNTDLHLLGHAVGDILYKQQGLDGIKICTQDFRNSCSHSIVVGLFIDKGVEALEDISKVCREAPGGTGAYGMCFHGLGHGILAYTGYNMEKAVDLCKKTGTQALNYVETAECVGGITMEMVAGVHDKKAWELQKDNYLKNSDPLFPCNQPFIPAVAKPNCFIYLTPHLWEAAGGNIDDPKEKDFTKAFTFCSKLTGVNEVYQDVCYGGFGKEFVGLSMARDIRKISDMGDKQLRQVYEWCLLAKETKAIRSCLFMAINSIYWGGENKPTTVVNFCKVMNEPTFKNSCYEHSIGAFKFYNARTPSKLNGMCSILPENYKSRCLDLNYYEPLE